MQQNMKLDPNTPMLDCVLERNKRVKERLHLDFFGGKHKKGKEARGQDAGDMDGEKRFELRTFTVSAKEFQSLGKTSGTGEEGRAEVFETAAQTEIPALQQLVRAR